MKELDVIETLSPVVADDDGTPIPVGTHGTIVLEYSDQHILVEFSTPRIGLLATLDRRDAKVVWVCS